jgi:hypothetical protein
MCVTAALEITAQLDILGVPKDDTSTEMICLHMIQVFGRSNCRKSYFTYFHTVRQQNIYFLKILKVT